MKCKIEIEVDLESIWPDGEVDISEVKDLATSIVINSILRPAKANANRYCRILEGEKRHVYENRIALIDEAIDTIDVQMTQQELAW